MLFSRNAAELMREYCDIHQGKPVPKGFSYNSGKNSDWLTVDQIRSLIRDHVDSSFEPA